MADFDAVQVDIERLKADARPATRGHVAAAIEGIVGAVAKELRANRDAREALARRLETTDQLIADLEQRLAVLEARK
ncbi:MAG: hypothetical protein KJ011_01745 [Burkholderiaceae bacterium]|nr:hypothetical protein [Burkholderiaceae bacterium]